MARILSYPGGRGIAEVEIARNSNFHAHFRRGAMMRAVTAHILRHVRYALVMPNTGPIRTIEEALAYRQELLDIAAAEVDHPVDLVMTLYLTDLVTPEVIDRLASLDVKFGVKYYPPTPGATTGSGFGIPLTHCHETLQEMERTGVPLLGHFEETHDKDGRELPPEEREAYMIEHVLWKFRDAYPRLRHCVEHASTRQAVPYVKADESGNTVMTVTPQHSLFVSDDFDDLGTELKCMPIVKSPEDRDAIVEFITSGDFRAIAGDDTAPHPHKSKMKPFGEAANGCWLPHSLELYAEVFNRAKRRPRWNAFESFMSFNGPRWWGLPPPDVHDTITLRRSWEGGDPEPVPIPGEDDVVVPLGWSPEGTKFRSTFRVT